VGSGEDLWNYAQYFPRAARYRNLDIKSNQRVNIVADVRCIPIPSCSEDCILAAFMLYHLDDVRDALREFKRVLKPGGILLTTYQPHQPPYYIEEETGSLRKINDGGPWKTGQEELTWEEALSIVGDFFTVESIETHVERHDEADNKYLFIKAVKQC